MATRPQQVVIMQGMGDKIQRALHVALKFNQGTVNLDPDYPDTAITLSQAQKDALTANFDALVAGVKADAGTL